MEKILNYLIPAAIVVLFVGGAGAYYYLTSVPASGLNLDIKVLEDDNYLATNQAKYADCHYTIGINADTSISTITNRFFNKGVSRQKLEVLESQFKDKYTQQCAPIIHDYEERYSQYQEHRKQAAESRLTKLDELLDVEAEVEHNPSSTFSLYEEYEPKSLQYPTNRNAKMLYTADDYAKYVEENL